MWTTVMLTAGVLGALAILSTIPRLPATLRVGAVVAAALVLGVFVTLGSFQHVGEDEIGVVVKNVGFQGLPAGQIIAVEGEKGPQARVLGPGWHPWLWPVFYTVEKTRVVEIGEGEVGLLTASDGLPLPPGEIFAPEWDSSELQTMLDAEHFLGAGGGFKGPQTTVLTPGKYRFNPKLFSVDKKTVTNIAQATVGVVKSNVGPSPAVRDEANLVPRGSRGIWDEPLLPQKYYLNADAKEVIVISTEEKTVRFTALEGSGEEREIEVISSDGFKFPVDVRVEFRIRESDAPLVVAHFGDDGDRLRERMNSVVRAVFRNNAENVKALDYVKQRSRQETQSAAMIADEMKRFGVTVTAVRIGDVGDQTLAALLKTQTDREIALQEQVTFQEQQRAAEQRKALSRTEQEAEEERRLATAQYQVQIAEQEKQQRIIGAEAQAEQIRIEAEAQAEAFRVVAQQIGPTNAALIELLKIVGEKGVQITPRVMVAGQGAGSGADGQTTALIGTMLDSMIARDENEPARAQAP